jgi:hypothetical protein
MYNYNRCPSCRINHRDGPKHVFKATHKRKLQTILDKAAAKLIALRVRQYLDSPSLSPTSKQAERSYWCWFCEEEIDNSANQFHWYPSSSRVDVNMYCANLVSHGAPVRPCCATSQRGSTTKQCTPSGRPPLRRPG